MHKSSFFAFLAVFLLILLGIKGFHLLQYRPWHADGHFRYLSAAAGATEIENGYFRRHERTVRRRGGAPEVDLAIRRQLDADAAAASLIAVIPLTLVSRLFAILLKTPVTVFLLPGIFPLVPGAGIYYTAYYFIQSNNALALSNGISTFKTAVALATGIALVLGIPLPHRRR